MEEKLKSGKSPTLTDAMVRHLPAPDRGRSATPDPSLPGFHVRVSETGERSFCVWWRVPKKFGGEERKGLITLGSYPAISLEAARARAREVLEIAQAGRDPRDVLRETAEAEARAKRQKEANSLQAIVRKYLDDKRPRLRPLTIKDYDLSFTAYLEGSDLGLRPIGEISRREVREYLRARAQSNGPSIGIRMHSMIRSAMRWAADEEIVDFDSLASLRFEHRRPERDRVLTDEEIKSLWKALDDCPPLVAGAVRLQLATATRYPSEPLSMTWYQLKQAHVEKGHLTDAEGVPAWDIPGEARKRGIPHIVPLSPLAVEIIEAMRPLTGNKPHVFEGLTEGLMAVWWKKARARVMKETGGPSFCHHDLRRTAATGCARMGAAPFVVERALGHKERGLGPTYNKWEYLREKHEALCRWADHLRRIIAADVDGAAIVPLRRA